MAEVILPISRPTFIDGFFETPAAGTWTGSHPYLDTFDESTSMGTVVAGASERDVAAFYQGVIPTGATAVKRLRFQARVHGGTVDSFWYFLDPRPNDEGGQSNFCSADFTPPAGQWATYTIDDPFAAGSSYVSVPDFLAMLAGVGVLVGVGGYDDTFDVSAIELTLEAGIPPLRQIQRDDGLLRSAKRARGGRSRQASNRQRGYL